MDWNKVDNCKHDGEWVSTESKIIPGTIASWACSLCGVRLSDAEYQSMRLTKRAADGALLPRCPVCGTTEHTIDEKGFVIPNPPRR